MIIKKLELRAAEQFCQMKISPETRRAYASDIRTFEAFLCENFPHISTVDELQPAHIETYRTWLISKLKPLSVNRKLATLKSYFLFLKQNSLIKDNPSTPIQLLSRKDYRPTMAISNGDVKKLLQAVSHSPIESAIMHVAFGLGLRRSEICNLMNASIKLQKNRWIISVMGKGRKTRFLPLTDDIMGVINAYKSQTEREANPLSPLFSWNHTMKVHPNYISKVFKRAALKAGITDRISPHTARATAVSMAFENGATPSQVMQMGGWVSLDMPIRYHTREIELKDSAVWKIKY